MSKVRVFDSVDGELLVVIHSPQRPADCSGCVAEANKLAALFDNRSPQISLNAHLAAIVFAEVVPGPINSHANTSPQVSATPEPRQNHHNPRPASATTHSRQQAMPFLFFFHAIFLNYYLTV